MADDSGNKLPEPSDELYDVRLLAMYNPLIELRDNNIPEGYGAPTGFARAKALVSWIKITHDKILVEAGAFKITTDYLAFNAADNLFKNRRPFEDSILNRERPREGKVYLERSLIGEKYEKILGDYIAVVKEQIMPAFRKAAEAYEGQKRDNPKPKPAAPVVPWKNPTPLERPPAGYSASGHTGRSNRPLNKPPHGKA